VSKIFGLEDLLGERRGGGGMQIAKLLFARRRRRGPRGDLITVLSFGGTRLIIQWRQKGRNRNCSVVVVRTFRRENGYMILFFLSANPPLFTID
jgi:hypothetical protein